MNKLPPVPVIDTDDECPYLAKASLSDFVQTVKEQYPSLIRKSYAYLKCDGLAEDAVQEGILCAHKNLSTLKNKAALKSWLYTIVLRSAINLLKKNKRHTLFTDELEELVNYGDHGLLNAPMWAGSANPEEEILKSEGLQRVKMAMESLSDEYRVPILLKDFDGFSVREISDLLGISESNVRVRVHRARIKLSNQLNDYFYPDKAGETQ